MADAKLVWDMDTGPADKKIDALGKKMDALGGKTPSFEGSVKGLAQMIGKLALVDRLVGGIAAGFQKASTAAAGNSKQAGGARLERDLNLQRLGLGAAGNALIEGATGGASIADRDSLLASLANSKNKFSKATSVKALRLGASGLYSQKEIMEGAENGQLDRLLAGQGARFAKLSPQAQEELLTRSMEARGDVAKADAAGTFGQTARLAASKAELARLENPVLGGVADGIQKALPAGFGDASAALESAVFQGQQLQELKKIREEVGGKLNLSAGSEGSR